MGKDLLTRLGACWPWIGDRGLSVRGRGPWIGVYRRPPGFRARVRHLGLCAAPQLRGPAGLGCAAPQLRGLAVERPRRFRVHGLRDCVQGRPFRVLRGPVAARPRRFRTY